MLNIESSAQFTIAYLSAWKKSRESIHAYLFAPESIAVLDNSPLYKGNCRQAIANVAFSVTTKLKGQDWSALTGSRHPSLKGPEYTLRFAITHYIERDRATGIRETRWKAGHCFLCHGPEARLTRNTIKDNQYQDRVFEDEVTYSRYDWMLSGDELEHIWDDLSEAERTIERDRIKFGIAGYNRLLTFAAASFCATANDELLKLAVSKGYTRLDLASLDSATWFKELARYNELNPEAYAFESPELFTYWEGIDLSFFSKLS